MQYIFPAPNSNLDEGGQYEKNSTQQEGRKGAYIRLWKSI